jgi:hypothetical protein
MTSNDIAARVVGEAGVEVADDRTWWPFWTNAMVWRQKSLSIGASDSSN